MGFQKAIKSKSKLRLALFAPSGGGKTFTALQIAKGIVSRIGGSIAVIDSENGAASKYADRFEFDVDELDDKTIQSYIAKMKVAAEGGYKVLVIDSMSHAWKELLEAVDKIAQARYRGNTWSAWSEGTPLQNELIETILKSPCHLIATMRSKTEWSISKNDRGKDVPTRVGLAPEQGKGIEYEFDMLIEMTTDHIANVIKDRTGKFQDQIIDKPGVELGQAIIDWLNTGVDEQILIQRKLEAMPEVQAIKETLAKYTERIEQNIKDFAEAEVKKDHTSEWFSRLNMKILNNITPLTNEVEDITEEVA